MKGMGRGSERARCVPLLVPYLLPEQCRCKILFTPASASVVRLSCITITKDARCQISKDGEGGGNSHSPVLML